MQLTYIRKQKILLKLREKKCHRAINEAQTEQAAIQETPSLITIDYYKNITHQSMQRRSTVESEEENLDGIEPEMISSRFDLPVDQEINEGSCFARRRLSSITFLQNFRFL